MRAAGVAQSEEEYIQREPGLLFGVELLEIDALELGMPLDQFVFVEIEFFRRIADETLEIQGARGEACRRSCPRRR